MINLKAELRSADQNVASLLESLENVSDKLSMLQDDTKEIRTKTIHLHSAKAGITAALTRMDNISAHFKAADAMSERLSSGFDAEALHQVSDSVEFLKGQPQWLSSGTTLRRLYELQEQARSSGLERLKQLWHASAPHVEGGVVGGAKLDAFSVDEAKAIIECLLATGDQRPLQAFGQVRGEGTKAALEALFEGDRDAFLQASAPYAPGSHPFTELAHVTLKLLQQEREYCVTLLDHTPHSMSVVEETCAPAVGLLSECGSRCTELLLSNSEWTGVDGLGFTVLVDLSSTYSVIHGELVALCQPQGSPTALSGTLRKLSEHLRVEALHGLAAVLDDVRTDATPIPATATVSVLTSNAMRAVRRVLSVEPQYLQVVQGSYESHEGTPLPAKLMAIMGSWSADVFIGLLVDELVKSLERKEDAAPLKPTPIAHAAASAKKNLFMVNNLSYVITGIKARAANDAALKKKVSALQERYDAGVKEFCTMGWSTILEHVTPIPEGTLVITKNKTSFESGRILKARFDSFNDDFEEFVTALGSLSIPDAALREHLRGYIMASFVPSCEEFHDKYAGITFSKKHQDKYLRNNPEVLKAKISELFL